MASYQPAVVSKLVIPSYRPPSNPQNAQACLLKRDWPTLKRLLSLEYFISTIWIYECMRDLTVEHAS